jgi:hypothetical protein
MCENMSLQKERVFERKTTISKDYHWLLKKLPFIVFCLLLTRSDVVHHDTKFFCSPATGSTGRIPLDGTYERVQ